MMDMWKDEKNMDYSRGYADGLEAGLLNMSSCMHMMIDEAKCTSFKYHKGFEAGFTEGLSRVGKTIQRTAV